MQPKLTPLMQQYWDVKSQHEDKVILFRMGDFFEMFHSDAETAAPILNIALTQRNKKDSESAKMCGVPHHSIAGPIAKLLAAGHKVAICDQIEDPATAKGIVKRAVTRVLTPGMVYDPDTLDELTAHYLAAYDETLLALVDVTTGSALAYPVENEVEREELLSLLRPVELVLSAKQIEKRRSAPSVCTAVLSELNEPVEPRARLLQYIEKMQGAATARSIAPFENRAPKAALRMNANTIRHLEILENSRGGRDGTLFEAVNRTRTSAGARMLKSWLMAPLRDLSEIMRRQDEIQAWVQDSPRMKSFRAQLGDLGDVERRTGKVHSTTFNARDLRAIAQSLITGRALSALHPAAPALEGLHECLQLAQRIEGLLADDLPHGVKEGGLIRQGALPELDELICLTQDMQKLLLELEAREKASTGISSLKVRYNNVFGFYIELTKTHSHKAPEHYRRKQTLTNAERYTTDELTALEEKVLSARTRRDQLEFEIFSNLKNEVIELGPQILALARVWARWDVTAALGWLAVERNYCRPVFITQGAMKIELGRHPVIEQASGSGVARFTPNSVELKSGEALLLTGPNMAGKSTLMRQVALIAVLAQSGSMVPATQADLPLFDQVFTRIGASDALNEGLSTFMVEMRETADILRRVTASSLVIMDEVGRGTSTYDGLSLAQSILEYLLNDKRPYLLFATHYQELTTLSTLFPQLRNGHMSVQEKNGQIQFLHTLTPGPANRSYGIHVAKLAGLPGSVTLRAQALLKAFEGSDGRQMSLGDLSMPVEADAPHPLLEEFKKLNLSQMTPLEALNKLFEWQREVSS
jgi:DNA mismatch repair protein MutS